MDQSKVKEIVDRESPEMVRLMALDEWTIIFKYDYTAEKTYAECNALLDYRRATINFNPATFETEMDVITTLRHELFHVVLACYNLYNETVDTVLTASSLEAKTLARIWIYVQEQGVVALELMWERVRNEQRV